MATATAAPTAAVLPKNSTNVRPPSIQLQALRLALGAASRLAPGWTDRALLARFQTPPRPRALPPEPEVAGVPARRFTVHTSQGPLAAWAWGEGPTVLLAHGWGGHAGQLTALAAAVVARGLRAVAFDMPGHGRSAGRRTNVVLMAEVLREVAEDVSPLEGLAPVPLAGLVAHSLGGAAATIALSRGLQARRVVLLAPVAEPTHFARGMGAFLGLLPARARALVDNVVAQLGGLAAVRADTRARLVAAPALVFHDRADGEVPFAHGEETARAWAGGATLVPLEGLGHRRLLRDVGVVERATRFLVGEAGAAAAGEGRDGGRVTLESRSA
jgi:pimeloyl-ACP methyl ester carboxylesterase